MQPRWAQRIGSLDMTESKKPARRKASDEAIFTAEEKAAMREYAEEKKAAGRKTGKADGEADVLAKIASMAAADRALAERIHALVKQAAPDLEPRTWYGMPAYARGGKIICFFQDAAKFKSRYATLGFSDQAQLDEGNMWPSAYALKALSADDEARILALIRRAVGEP